MKKRIKILLGIILYSFIFSITVYANVNKKSNSAGVSVDGSILLPAGVNESTGYGNVARGDYLSSASLSITNKGYGEIGIYACTLCHVPVKKIQMNVYLDRWDEDRKDWVQVDYYKFTYKYEEGGEDLTSVTESFSVLGLPTGIYYRLRSANVVYAFDGTMEVQGPKTDGLLITDGPVY